MAHMDKFFGFTVKKQNLNDFDKAALACGMNPDELTEIIQDGNRNWHSVLANGNEVATWITYNGRLCFAGLMTLKEFNK